MAKTKTSFLCQACGAQFIQWSGHCKQCGAWNSISEETITIIPRTKSGYAGEAHSSEPILLEQVELAETPRISVETDELDRVLGGGLVLGSVILIGGDPGIGKSTLLLQTTCQLSMHHPVLYVTGEESLQQVALRAKRLGLPEKNLQLLTETRLEQILQTTKQLNAKLLVIDSIQTMHTDLISSAPGAVGQLRESTAELVRFAKQTGTIILIIGHVTKEGAIAGPRVLEHMVDTVLYFEGLHDSRFRVVRAVKNRFGAVNEVGLFAMTEKGLRPVTNPSAIFLSRSHKPTSGSVVMVTWEGTRPLLVEIQALVDETHLSQPRRVAIGFDHNRLAMLLAVLHKQVQVATFNQDVFVNAVGGVRILETAADLALILAVISSLKNRIIPSDTVIFGEVGLSGEIRPVQSGQARLVEAVKHGFKRAIIPRANLPKQKIDDITIHPIDHLSEVMNLI